jgi:hypothetical protein
LDRGCMLWSREGLRLLQTVSAERAGVREPCTPRGWKFWHSWQPHTGKSRSTSLQ